MALAMFGTSFHRGKLTIGKNVRCDVPLVCNGRGTVSIGSHVGLGYHLGPLIGNGRITLQAREPFAKISIGDRTELSNNINVIANKSITIGNDCLIADMVTIFDSDFHDLDPTKRLDKRSRAESDGGVAETLIGNNVWICSRSLVLRGAQVGDHSVVAAGSVVVGVIPERVLVGGVPSRVIRHL